MERPPLTPVTARIPRIGSRGSISSVQSTGRRAQNKKFHTWNPRSSASGRINVPRSGGTMKLERTNSSRGSVCSSTGSTCTTSQSKASPSVCVMVRVRPLVGPEQLRADQTCIEVIESEDDEEDEEDLDENNNQMKKGSVRIGGKSGQVFHFDRVFGVTEGQDAVFRDAGKPIAENALQGFNASIFAYGQTGSGKTYTMQGDPDNHFTKGLIPRVLEFCFAGLERLKRDGVSVVAHCSFLEIYNEQVYDLLDRVSKEEANAPGYTQPSKSLREDMKKGVFVENAVEECIENVEEAFHHIRRGASQKHVSATNMNRESSRSHSIFTLSLELRIPGNESTGTLETTRTSKINLVDLAGSERQRATKATGDRLTEAKHINKSLSALGNVISALVERSRGRVQHVPHRDSILTYLLRDSLGGNTKTSIIATVSPDSANFQDTLSTLQFGQRAKRVKITVKANTSLCSDPVILRREIRRLQGELDEQKKIASSTLLRNTSFAKSITSNKDFRDEDIQFLNDSHVQYESDAETSQVGVDFQHPPKNLTEDLARNSDFIRLENKVTKVDDVLASERDVSSENGKIVLRKRITHLEKVLAELLNELDENRGTLQNLKDECRNRKEVEEVLRDSVAAKELVNHLHEQKIKDLEANNFDKLQEHNALLKETLETTEELELRSEIAQLKAENASLAQYYRVVQSGQHESHVLRFNAVQVQLQAVLDDKSELERIVKDLGEENTKLQEAQDAALESRESDILDKKFAAALQASASEKDDIILELQCELRSMSARAESLEQELFLQMEKNAVMEAQAYETLSKTDRSSSTLKPIMLDMDSSLLDEDGGLRGKCETDPTTRSVMLAAANIQRSARKMVQEHRLDRLGENSAGESSAVTDEAEILVRRKLLTQLADARRHLREAEKNNRRLSVQLERKTNAARKQKQKLRKSLTTKDTNIDKEHLNSVRLELELSNMRDKYERLLCNNKELQEAVEMANTFADYKSKQYDDTHVQLESLKRRMSFSSDAQGSDIDENGKSYINRIPSSNTIGSKSDMSFATPAPRAEKREPVSLVDFFPSESSASKRQAELFLEKQEVMSQGSASTLGDETDLEDSFASASTLSKNFGSGKRSEKSAKAKSNLGSNKKGTFRFSSFMRGFGSR